MQGGVAGRRFAAAIPAWVPEAARRYLLHTEAGLSIRALARGDGCHASTVLRQVRRLEARRDDPLVDEALRRLVAAATPASPATPERPQPEDHDCMTAMPRIPAPGKGAPDATTIEREARRILRRLAEPGAVLAIAPALDRAAVLRELPGGASTRTGVVDRAVAQAFALNDWIAARSLSEKVAVYEITAAGRAALKRLLADEAGEGFAEAPARFAEQHRVWGERVVEEDGASRRVRYNASESPLALLARRREKDGQPFLAPELVSAGERLREDFELAQMGPRVAQNWERFLTAGADRGSFRAEGGKATGPDAARRRVASALADLGPGLGDMVLRVCCFLEGIEGAEKRMGWAARSGKIVLRIALMRLRRHYDEVEGRYGALIG